MDAVLETLEKEGIPILDGRMKSPDPSGGCILWIRTGMCWNTLSGWTRENPTSTELFVFVPRRAGGDAAARGALRAPGTPGPGLCAFL